MVQGDFRFCVRGQGDSDIWVSFLEMAEGRVRPTEPDPEVTFRASAPYPTELMVLGVQSRHQGGRSFRNGGVGALEFPIP